MRGLVALIKQKMAGTWKTVCGVTVLTLKWLWKTIIVLGSDLMTQFVRLLSNLYAWTVSNIKHYLVPQIIVEEYNKGTASTLQGQRRAVRRDEGPWHRPIFA